jgi:hypothetical protein
MNELMKLNQKLEPKQLDYDEWLPEHGIDYHTRTEFICGGCYSLAQQIHLITGWPIFAEIEYNKDDEDFIHAWVVNDDGFAVDISGVHSNGWAKTKFSSEKPVGTIVEYPVDETFGYYSQWAKDILHSLPEHFGIQDFILKNDLKNYLKKIKIINEKSKKYNQLIIKSHKI